MATKAKKGEKGETCFSHLKWFSTAHCKSLVCPEFA